MNRIATRGSAAVKGMIALGVLILIGAAVWYFVSDIFRTKVDAGFTQATKWTPENIAKDPQNYLNYVEAETIKAQQSLKASRIAIAQNRSKLESIKSEASAKINTGEKAIKELVSAYKTASVSNAFPISWNGRNLEKEKVQQQVVALDKEVKIQKKSTGQSGKRVEKVGCSRKQNFRGRGECSVPTIRDPREPRITESSDPNR
ncbi:MAG: hypothetical protein KatS3mg104_2863 [Phycisphaerae bacterium]|nr:MAG: hypothetical protein KatS3mg104_2863 [Phycisphaerae bacterium]